MKVYFLRNTNKFTFREVVPKFLLSTIKVIHKTDIIIIQVINIVKNIIDIIEKLQIEYVKFEAKNLKNVE
jgi:hypothetical protein